MNAPAPRTVPLHPLFGVEVQDVELATVDDTGHARIRALFETHSVLLFRGQDLTDDDHMRLAERFGPIEDRNADERPKGEKMSVPSVSNIREDGSLTGEMDLHTLHLKANMLWHCDSTFMPQPALCNILIGRIVTRTGGETQLASTRAAWAQMPETLKARLRHVRLRHHYSHSRARISPELAALPMFHKWPAQSWPAVWRNPVNGAEALYVASHAYEVEGMDPKAGAGLIDEALEWATQSRFVFSHRWNVGDVLVWDQRAVLHRATPWNSSEPRKLTSLCVSATDEDGLAAMTMR
ncbi:MAG: TauD/TfdA family dioxygenase [Rhodobacteraceae bacterium]|nr:TauD/TfdA family dioxygenase [Paracoccaceae bacterium]